MKKLHNYQSFNESLFKWKDVKNFIDTKIEDVWRDIDMYLSDDFNNGHVEVTIEQSDVERGGRNLPILKIRFSLLSDEGVVIAGHSFKSLEPLKDHSCYSDLINAHYHTISALSLDAYHDVTISRRSYDNAHTMVIIEYKLIEQYLQSVEFQINRHASLINPYRYLEPLKGLNMENHPTVKMLLALKNIRDVRSDFGEIFRNMINYGFIYDHCVDAAKKFDLQMALENGCEKRDVFFVSLFTKDYSILDSMDFQYSYLLYTESSPLQNVGYHLMSPVFNYCLKNTEIFWDYEDKDVNTIALVYLIFNHKLLGNHLEGGNERGLWMKIITETFNRVATNLIAYDRKEAMKWLYDLIISEDPSESDKKAVEKFTGDIKLHMSRIKSHISSHKIDSGKYLRSEVPDYNYFEDIRIKLLEYIS